DVSQPEELAQICSGVGLDPNDVAEKITSEDIKGRLRANTDELVARGGFGSPTMFINGSDMYFGNDRLPLVEAALTRAVQAES
ncbi:MAG: DsbA family protein, partial [Pseudomonadota bacterium]|nr:DsbA family protein [Pseudomonadota bacterium]